MTDESAHLVAVAHGTRDPAGLQTNAELVELIRRQRPEISVSLCWLDLGSPTLDEALAAAQRSPVVVVPVLLSTGVHVTKDIPNSASRHPRARLASHLGPHPLLARVLEDRLRAAPGPAAARTVLIGAGSSEPRARLELRAAADQLAEKLGTHVGIGQLTDPDPLAAAAADDQIATYLLAPGYFTSRLRAIAGHRRVAAELGAHPAIAELIWRRYDEALLSAGEPTATSSG